MSAQIRIPRRLWDELEASLGRAEQATFMLADVNGPTFDVVDLRVMQTDDYKTRSSLHLDLRDEARPELISWAWKRGLSLIEAHSHGPGHPKFSRSDLRGFDDWVPHLWWRLQGSPYAALVKSGAEWDAMAWLDSPYEPEPVEVIEIVEASEERASSMVVPNGATLELLTEARG